MRHLKKSSLYRVLAYTADWNMKDTKLGVSLPKASPQSYLLSGLLQKMPRRLADCQNRNETN
jgi:hypothetical protein